MHLSHWRKILLRRATCRLQRLFAELLSKGTSSCILLDLRKEQEAQKSPEPFDPLPSWWWRREKLSIYEHSFVVTWRPKAIYLCSCKNDTASSLSNPIALASDHVHLAHLHTCPRKKILTGLQINPEIVFPSFKLLVHQQTLSHHLYHRPLLQ